MTLPAEEPVSLAASVGDAQFVAPSEELPSKPIISISPGRGSLELRDLWQSRELLYVLTLRDIKVRYKQSVLGILWAAIQPLSTMIIFTVFFGRLALIPSDGVPYPLFALVGLVPWTFFSNAVTNSSNSLVGDSSLITRVYFPRMIIPLASVGAGLVDLSISFSLLAVLMVIYGTAFPMTFLLLPVLILLTALLAAGVGMWMAALNVRYRDIRHALPFFMQLWLFVTPIIYPSTFIPEKWRWALTLNPLAGLIEGYRSAIFGRPFDLTAIAISATGILAICLYSLRRFRKLEREFADII